MALKREDDFEQKVEALVLALSGFRKTDGFEKRARTIIRNFAKELQSKAFMAAIETAKKIGQP